MMFALSMPLDASAQYTQIHIHVQQVLFIQRLVLPGSSASFPNKCYKCNTFIATASGEPAVTPVSQYNTAELPSIECSF